MELERRALTDDCELRLEDDGRKLSGVALFFGRVAKDRPERFAPGSFNLEGADVILGMKQHPAAERPLARTGGGGLELTADHEALRFTASLIDTADSREAVALVRARVLRDMSIEFVPVKEHFEGGVRVITSAELRGLITLARGAYQSDVQARTRDAGDDSEPRYRVWL